MTASEGGDGAGDGAGGGWGEDLRVAALFLTRLPLAVAGAPAPGRLAGAARAFPVVGVGLGFAAGLVYAAAHSLGLPPGLAALAALAALILLTGALHEDALADLADGLGGGSGRDDKLEIMRDSRLGSYGAVALVLALLARLGALAAIAEPGAVMAALIAAGAVSRTAMVGLMHRLEPARRDGQGAAAGRPDDPGLYTALAIAAVVALVLVGLAAGLAALLAAGLGAAAIGALARRQIGGSTGDVLGAGQQAAEVLFLFAVVALS